MREEFLDIYARQPVHRHRASSRAWTQLLDRLDAEGIAWGVVTNKFERLARPVLDGLGLGSRAAGDRRRRHLRARQAFRRSAAARRGAARRRADEVALRRRRRARRAGRARRGHEGDRRGLRLPRRRPAAGPVGRGCDRRFAARHRLLDGARGERQRRSRAVRDRHEPPPLPPGPRRRAARGRDARRSPRRGTTNRLLVLVYLHGGNDGYNTWVPYTDAALLPAAAQHRRAARRGAEGHRPAGLPPVARAARAAVRGARAGARPGHRAARDHAAALSRHRDGVHRERRAEFRAEGWVTRALARRALDERAIADAVAFDVLDIREADPMGPMRGDRQRRGAGAPRQRAARQAPRLRLRRSTRTRRGRERLARGGDTLATGRAQDRVSRRSVRPVGACRGGARRPRSRASR